jgi:hypothetical protein
MRVGYLRRLRSAFDLTFSAFCRFDVDGAVRLAEPGVFAIFAYLGVILPLSL